jgi:hypothetical protein
MRTAVSGSDRGRRLCQDGSSGPSEDMIFVSLPDRLMETHLERRIKSPATSHDSASAHAQNAEGESPCSTSPCFVYTSDTAHAASSAHAPHPDATSTTKVSKTLKYPPDGDNSHRA